MFDYEKFNEYMKRKFPESMSDWWVQQLVENLAQWIMETCEGIEKIPKGLRKWEYRHYCQLFLTLKKKI